MSLSSLSSSYDIGPLCTPLVGAQNVLRISEANPEILIFVPETSTIYRYAISYVYVQIKNHSSSPLQISMEANVSDPQAVSVVSNSKLAYPLYPDEEICFLLWIRAFQNSPCELMLAFNTTMNCLGVASSAICVYDFAVMNLTVDEPFNLLINPHFFLTDESIFMDWKLEFRDLHEKASIDSHVVQENDAIVQFHFNTFMCEVKYPIFCPIPDIVILVKVPDDMIETKNFEAKYYIRNFSTSQVECTLKCVGSADILVRGYEQRKLVISENSTAQTVYTFIPIGVGRTVIPNIEVSSTARMVLNLALDVQLNVSPYLEDLVYQ